MSLFFCALLPKEGLVLLCSLITIALEKVDKINVEALLHCKKMKIKLLSVAKLVAKY